MPKRLDLTGHEYGKLIVLKLHESRNGRTYWNCYCEPQLGGCGKENVIVITGNLRSGNTTSCGCCKAETRTLDRTGNINGKLRVIDFSHTVKKEGYWTKFWNCYCDPILGGCGKYHKVRTTALDNPKDTTACGCGKDYQYRMMTLNGVTKTMAAWSRDLGISYAVLSGRTKRMPPWSDEDILTKPVRRSEHYKLRATVRKLTKEL